MLYLFKKIWSVVRVTSTTQSKTRMNAIVDGLEYYIPVTQLKEVEGRRRYAAFRLFPRLNTLFAKTHLSSFYSSRDLGAHTNGQAEPIKN